MSWSTKQDDLRKKVLNKISSEEALKHIKWLYENIGERLAGSPEERKTVDYFKRTLEDYGLEPEIYEFDGLVSFPRMAELKVLRPEERTIKCSCYAQIASTPLEGIERELVYIGAGGDEDYKKIDAKGKITLSELSYDPARPEKIRLAEKYGSIAQIQMNWGYPDSKILPLGTVKYIWGNPTPKTLKKWPKIPAVGISRADGLYLKELLEKGPVRVWMRAEATHEWRKIYDVAVTVRGTEEPEKFVLIHGHFDAWGGATTCNATGNAALLELSRVLSKYKSSLKRSVRFAWWSAHETGMMEGSTWYVDNLWDDINENAIANLNCDSPGMKGTIFYVSINTPELAKVHAQMVKETLGEVELSVIRELAKSLGMDEAALRVMKAGDQSFLGVGIPSSMGVTMFPPDVLMKTAGANLGWWYHSVEDTPDKVDPEALLKTMKVYTALILKLCNSPILPLEFVSTADEFTRTLTDLESEGGEILSLTSLIECAKEFRILAERLEEVKGKLRTSFGEATEERRKRLEEGLKLINRCLMKLSRILIPVNYTIVGKYDQDTYGRTDLNRPIPILQPLIKLAAMDSESGEFKTLKTKLVRERNKVSDALKESIEVITDTIQEISPLLS